MVVVGVMEAKHDLSQVLEGGVHRDRCLHLLVSNKDNLVGHVEALI